MDLSSEDSVLTASACPCPTLQRQGLERLFREALLGAYL